MRRGFNLLMAIFIILVLSGAAILTMKYVSISAKHISDSYTQEQAQMFARSVLEATLLRIEGYDRSINNDCLKELNVRSEDGRFIARVDILRYYIYNNNSGENLSNCIQKKDIKTNESNGYVSIQIVVETNSSHPKIKGFVEPRRVVLRSLQRP